MQLLALGLNHQTAPLALRERVAFVPDEVGNAIARLRDRLAARDAGQVTEAAIVSTCNRTELYCAAREPDAAGIALAEFIASAKQLDSDEIRRASYVLPQTNAVRHAFRVASGLDSMVIGEPQILGQMKQAEKLAREAGGMGPLLHHLFQRTFAVAKEVRTTTEIGTQSVSLAAAAVRVAERIYGELGECNILFVGAGEMVELTATHFAARRPKSICVANRTVERAEGLASRLHGEAMQLAELPDQLARFDIVVSCTASTLPIIGLGMVERAIRNRRHRPMFIVDLAVPRDVEPEVARLEDVYVYTVDELGKIVQSGTESRLAAVAQAEAIIESRVRDFESWLKTRAAVPVIQGLRERAHALRSLELERARKLLARGESPEAVLEQFGQALTNKLLHSPVAALHHAADADEAERARLLALFARFHPDADHYPCAVRGSGPHGSAACACLQSTMKPSMRNKLGQLERRLGEIDSLLAREDATRDMERFKALSRERAEIEPVVLRYQDYNRAAADLAGAQEMLADPDMKVLAEEETHAARGRMDTLESDLQRLLLPKDPNDERNIFLEIRAGTGGDESALFAGDLLRMYMRYAERKRWQTEMISESASDLGGYKEVIVRIVGAGAYSKLKFESGGHRVQRVPETEAQGRIHTSACTVAVLPEADDIDDVRIDPSEIRIDVYRASGAGGQHVNKTESAVRITHLPTGIVVECQDDRSQHKNKERALKILAARIKDQQLRAQQAKEASTRRSLIGSGDRSERIRTYNFPQGRVTDHRINLTLYKIEQIMDGDLDELTAALTAEHQAEMLAALAEA